MHMRKPFQPVITWSHPDPPSDIILVIEPAVTPTDSKRWNIRNVSLLGCFGETVKLRQPLPWLLEDCIVFLETCTQKALSSIWLETEVFIFYTNYVSLKRKKRRKTLSRKVLKKLKWQERRTQQRRWRGRQKEQQKVNRGQEKKKARLPFFSLLFDWWKRARWSWWSVAWTCWMGPTSLVRWR